MTNNVKNFSNILLLIFINIIELIIKIILSYELFNKNYLKKYYFFNITL